MKHQQSERSRPAGYLLALLAIVTCPCHIPILVVLLAGSAAGTLLSEYYLAALLLFSLLFLLSVLGAMHMLGHTRKQRGRKP